MGLSQDVHTYEDQYDFSQLASQEVDDEIASQENDDEIASQKIEDKIGSKLDHVMEAQRLEQDMRKIGSSSNGGTKRQSINAYHASHPLFMEMMSAINKDPSSLLHFQATMNKSLEEANCEN